MIFRYARHTSKIAKLIPFYVNILELEILGEFKDHQEYNGVFIGKPHLNWHLEFTESPEAAHHRFDEDDLLVFYPETEQEYSQILQNIHSHRLEIRQAKNPYWNENGILIHDPDGFGVIISLLKIQKT